LVILKTNIKTRPTRKTQQKPLEETLIYSSIVIPAKAGIQKNNELDPGLRRGDELISAFLKHSLLEREFFQNQFNRLCSSRRCG
jgi:hypothetical protein